MIKYLIPSNKTKNVFWLYHDVYCFYFYFSFAVCVHNLFLVKLNITTTIMFYFDEQVAEEWSDLRQFIHSLRVFADWKRSVGLLLRNNWHFRIQWALVHRGHLIVGCGWFVNAVKTFWAGPWRGSPLNCDTFLMFRLGVE